MPINSLFDSFLSYLPIVIQLFPFHQNVKQGKEGGVKGKGFAKGEPIGEGETPCFALGFVVSPAHIGSPFAGEPQKKQRSQRIEENKKQTGKQQTFHTHQRNTLAK